jgi:hypothetical protein
MASENVVYRRADLYEEIWKEPVRTVAKRYGVSDVALGKICRRMRIPIPGLGHWARIRVGQVVPQPPLPSLPDGTPSEIIHERWRPRAERPDLPRSEPSDPPIIVPDKLHNPHKLVSETSRVLRGVRTPTDRRLDVSVSKESRGRALRIMNALLRALEKKGLKIEVTRRLTSDERQREERSGEEVFDGATRVHVDGEWVAFGIAEKHSLVHVPAPDPPAHLRGGERDSWIMFHPARRDLTPNGVLELIIKSGEYLGARRHWHDGKKKRVEDCLNDFIAHLHIMAVVSKNHRADMERARIERQEEERRRYEEQRRRWEEEEQGKRIEDKLRRWRLAEDARTYANEIRRLLAESGRIAEPGSSIEESLAELDAYAARVDPLGQLREPTQREAEAADGSD